MDRDNAGDVLYLDFGRAFGTISLNVTRCKITCPRKITLRKGCKTGWKTALRKKVSLSKYKEGLGRVQERSSHWMME